MEMKQVTKSEFTAMLKSVGNDRCQTIYENGEWYETVTIGEETYCHKLLVLKQLSLELLKNKAFKADPTVEPIRLRAQSNGPVVALVFNTKYTVFYHLITSTKSEMDQARRMVICYSRSLFPKDNKNQSKKTVTTFAA